MQNVYILISVLPCWLLFLVVFFSFIQGYSGTLTPGDPMPWGTSMGYPAPGGVFCGLIGGPCGGISPERWGNAVINSAMEGWLLMNPVSLHPSMGRPGWGAPEAALTADNQKPAAAAAPPLSGLLDLVFTTTKSSSSKCPVGIRRGWRILMGQRRAPGDRPISLYHHWIRVKTH